jgi:hypothetical protein
MMLENCFVMKDQNLWRRDLLGGVKSISGKSSSAAASVVDEPDDPDEPEPELPPTTSESLSAASNSSLLKSDPPSAPSADAKLSAEEPKGAPYFAPGTGGAPYCDFGFSGPRFLGSAKLSISPPPAPELIVL